MDFTGRVLFVILCLGLAILIQNYIRLSRPLPAPQLDLNAYWGPGDKISYKENPSLIPNKIRYSDEVINELKSDLKRTLHLHDPLEGVGFEYGFNSKNLKEIVTYWRDDYLPRWRERESFLWRLPHFTTQIQGLQIHYIHTKIEQDTKSHKVIPVLLLHGWPGSVREFYDIIPKLSIPNNEHNYIFEVVAPSLPGFGWSQAASKVGLGPAEVAVVLRNLMLRLGYKQFIIQGGDWGSLIGSNMATLFPENVVGYHSNMCVHNSPIGAVKLFIANFLPSLFVENEDEQKLYFPLSYKLSLLLEEMGYFHLQATKPDTIGAALSHNPVGLAAYILEKFSTWTNEEYKYLSDGGLQKKFKLDALLDNVMIYYLTNSITTSTRLYAESMTSKQRNLMMELVPTEVPTGCARFEHDLFHTPDFVLKEKFKNLVHVKNYKGIGHFPALEAPDVLYKDFVDFVDKVMKQRMSASKKV